MPQLLEWHRVYNQLQLFYELDLTEKHDTFSHTETTVVMKDDKDD